MKIKDSKLAIKILEMAKLDQNARKSYIKDPPFLIKMLDVDRANLIQMN